MIRITLTVKQIQALAEFAGFVANPPLNSVMDDEELETEVVIVRDDKGVRTRTLTYFKDYPEEGTIDLDDW